MFTDLFPGVPSPGSLRGILSHMPGGAITRLREALGAAVPLGTNPAASWPSLGQHRCCPCASLCTLSPPWGFQSPPWGLPGATRGWRTAPVQEVIGRGCGSSAASAQLGTHLGAAARPCIGSRAAPPRCPSTWA